MLIHQPLHQRDHLCSSTPTLNMHIRRNSTGDKDLDLLDSPQESLFYDSFSFDTDLEFQSASIVFSPPLWKSHCSRSTYVESRPLLPCNHVYSSSSSLSPVSRRRASDDGRRELMKMVENLPELTYELSLKDIVDARNSLEDKDEKEEHSDLKADTRITTPKKKKNSKGNLKRGPIKRTPSMESETFRIKMFFPAYLGSKKKAKPGKSGRLRSLESSNLNAKVQWSRKSSGDTTRNGKERDFIPGCWSFFYSKKSKSIRDERCL